MLTNVDTLSTVDQDTERTNESLDSNNAQSKLLTTVDTKKQAETHASHSIQPKTVDNVDTKNISSTKNKSAPRAVENTDTLNNSSSTLSTENSSTPEKKTVDIVDRLLTVCQQCQQF